MLAATEVHCPALLPPLTGLRGAGQPLFQHLCMQSAAPCSLQALE
jgi:hypothetical protein